MPSPRDSPPVLWGGPPAVAMGTPEEGGPVQASEVGPQLTLGAAGLSGGPYLWRRPDSLPV